MKNVALIICLSGLFSACNVTTANLKSSKICDKLNSDALCDEDIEVFDHLPDSIYISHELRNAPKSTKVRYYWYMIEEGEDFLIDSLTYENNSTSENIYTFLNTRRMPLGKYKVITKIMADNKDPVEKTFELKHPKDVNLHMIKIGSKIDESEIVLEHQPFFSSKDSMIYFSANVYNLPQNTDFTLSFTEKNGKLIKDIPLNSGNLSDQTVVLNANLNRNYFPLAEGGYQVRVHLLGKEYNYDFEIQP